MFNYKFISLLDNKTKVFNFFDNFDNVYIYILFYKFNFKMLSRKLGLLYEFC